METLPRKELRELQWQKLQTQLAYNYARSPFYRRKLDEVGLPPEKIRSWEDFWRIPPMDKHEHRRAQEEPLERFGHLYGMLACAPLESFVLLSGASGTTGTPTFYTLTLKDLAVLYELQARKFRRVGPWGRHLRLHLESHRPKWPLLELRVERPLREVIMEEAYTLKEFSRAWTASPERNASQPS